MNVVIAVSGLWAGIFVHEAGHAIGAALARMQIRVFSVWPVSVIRKASGGYRFRLSAKASFYGGGTYSMTTDPANLRRRRAITLLGGPLASLAAAIVVFGLLSTITEATPQLTNATQPMGEDYGAAFLGYLGLFSALFFVLSALPTGTKYYPNDGAQLWLLWKRPVWVTSSNATLLLQSALWDGIRPRDFDPTWVDQALELDDGSQQMLTAYYLAYLYAMDVGDTRQGGAYLDHIVKLGKRHWVVNTSAYALEYAYFAGRYRSDAKTARRWFEKGKASRDIDKAGHCLSEAAVLLAEHDLQAAQKRVAAGLEALADTPSAGLAQVRRERLDDLAEQIQFRGALIV